MQFEGRSGGPNRTEFVGTLTYDSDTKRFSIRVDDKNNPEFWMQIMLPKTVLLKAEQSDIDHNVYDQLFMMFEFNRDRWALEKRGKWVGLTLDSEPIFGNEERDVHRALEAREAKTPAIVQKIDNL